MPSSNQCILTCSGEAKNTDILLNFFKNQSTSRGMVSIDLDNVCDYVINRTEISMPLIRPSTVASRLNNVMNNVNESFNSKLEYHRHLPT